MNSIGNERTRTALISRFDNLSQDLHPIWGTMTAHQMVCHICDQLAVALGDIPSKETDTIFSRTILKWLVLYAMPSTPKGKIQTVPEMLSTETSTWSGDIERFKKLISRLSTEANPKPHPVFGPLSQHEWGIVSAKHIDHHLRQFGV